ncbi:Uncharacterized protein DAT39_010858 [Clarias magur]|uniref:Uncharacterized protein n=1 Tax=Clarias magur TaxID=1594786 RepID=A0A8J4XDR8_CLAMG|nr:Uncharacterized protein DAT39_010858 [Clarias magur]
MPSPLHQSASACCSSASCDLCSMMCEQAARSSRHPPQNSAASWQNRKTRTAHPDFSASVLPSTDADLLRLCSSLEQGQPQKCLLQSPQPSGTALILTVTNMAFNILLLHINCILLEFGVASSGAWHEATVATTINTKQTAMIQVPPGRSPKVTQIHTQTAQCEQAMALKLSL